MLDISRAPAVPSADTSWRSDVLLARLRSALALVSDPDKAPAMRAYMRSAMPYLGTAMPSVRTICRAVFAEIEYADQETWAADVRVIWRSACFREERYAAIELTGIPAAARFQNPKAFDLYDELIVTGAWWDFIDPLASQRLWTILREHRAPARREMLSWSKSPDMWKRRSSIICQLHAKQNTDLDLLYACIEPSIGSKEFFLRKAIGWALRQYARTDPGEVRRYVRSNRSRLSALSRREALKHL